MATLSINGSMTLVRTGRSSNSTGGATIEPTNALDFSKVVTATTTDSALSLSEATTPKAIMFTNLDDTNFVEIGPDDGAGNIVPMVRLAPGQGQPPVLLPPSVSLRIQSDTADVDVLVTFADA